LKEFLVKDHEKFDKFVIDGGDPLSLNESYFKSLVSILKEFNKTITLRSYPYTLLNTQEDIHYDFSYDFLAKAMPNDAWGNLYSFKKPFDLTITLSPALFSYHPNGILRKLSMLENLKRVEFVPYFKNKNSQYDINRNDSLKEFSKLLLGSQLNVPFTIVNKEIMNKKILKSFADPIDICLFPDGKLYKKDFVEDFLTFKMIDNIDDVQPNVLPESCDMYDRNIQVWYSQNILTKDF
jgi:hypothetical protein